MSENAAIYKTRQKMTADQAFNEYVQLNEDNILALISGEKDKRKQETLSHALRAMRLLRATVGELNKKLGKIKEIAE